jgi:O-antigen/teichoic acid export membrane protein
VIKERVIEHDPTSFATASTEFMTEPSRQGQSVPHKSSNMPSFGILRGAMGRSFLRISSSQFNKNMGAGSTMALIGTCLSIVSYPIYLHYLGYHAYGLWLILSVIVSVAQLGNLGIPWALMKLVAEDCSQGNWEGVKSNINISCGIIVGLGMVFVAGIVLLRPYVLSWFRLGGQDADAVRSLIPYVAALSVLVLLFSTFNAALGGLGRIDLTSYNEALVQIAVIAFCGLFLLFGFGLRAMVIGTLLGYLFAQIISLIQVQKMLPISLIGATRLNRHSVKQLLNTGGWILGGGICATMLLPFTRLMLSRYAGLEAVAVNDMCLTGSLRVRNVFDFAFRPMMPEVSRQRVNGGLGLSDLVRSIERKAFWVIFLVALPAFIMLIIAVNPLLHLWLHGSFNPLLPATFRIALVGAFVSLLGSSAYYILIGLGEARDTAFSTAIQFVVNSIVLSAVVASAGRITVAEAAMSFGIATVFSTIYLRGRVCALIRRLTSASKRIAP